MAKQTPSTMITERELNLMEQVGGLRTEVLFLEQKIERRDKEIDKLKEKYALLLRTHISMMEKCIPEIKIEEEEEDG